MGKKFVFKGVFIFVILINIISVFSLISIDIPKTEYSINESLIANIIISSNNSINGFFTFNVFSEESGLSISEQIVKEITLPPRSFDSFNEIVPILKGYNSGKYLIKGRLLNKDNQLIEEKIIYFNIIGTISDFSFSINTCKSSSCTEKSKIFNKNEEIYLDYSSDVSNISIDATLTYPDKTIQKITIPSSIKASQIGTYELNVIASKDGYKNISVKEQFGVIEKPAEIKLIKTENLSKYEIKSPNLSELNIPDLPVLNTDNSSSRIIFYIILFVIGLLIITIIIILAYFLLKKK